MEWVNVTAKSLPEAIDLALDNLGVDEAEAEIEVLEEPKQGLFGRTRGNARVKARVKPRTTRPKVDRGRNRRRRGDGPSGGSQNNRGGKGRSDSKRREGGSDRQSGTDRGQAKGAGKETAGDGGSNQKRSGRPKKQRQDQPAVKEATVEEVSEQIETFLAGLTEAFGFSDGVHVESDGEGGLIGHVDGRHGVLVGPRGRTLDAIQELTRVTVQRSAPSSVRIKVDVGGYREMRKSALQQFASEVADAVRADGRERSMEPMSSADRKIVHDALNGLDGITTRSAGTEPRRRVVVVPADSPGAEPSSVSSGDEAVVVDSESDSTSDDQRPIEVAEDSAPVAD